MTKYSDAFYVWPYIAVVAILFVLTIQAPESWRAIQVFRSQAVAPIASQVAHDSVASDRVVQAVPSHVEEQLAAADHHEVALINPVNDRPETDPIPDLDAVFFADDDEQFSPGADAMTESQQPALQVPAPATPKPDGPSLVLAEPTPTRITGNATPQDATSVLPELDLESAHPAQRPEQATEDASIFVMTIDPADTESTETEDDGTPAAELATIESPELAEPAPSAAPESTSQDEVFVAEAQDRESQPPSSTAAPSQPTFEQTPAGEGPIATNTTEKPGLPEVDAAAEQRHRWTAPARLIAHLAAIDDSSPNARWRDRVENAIHSLTETSVDDRRATIALNELQQLVDQAKRSIASARTDAQRSKLLRASYALERRIGIWQRAAVLSSAELPVSYPENESASDMRSVLRQVEAVMETEDYRDAWRQYLMLDRIATVTRHPEAFSDERKADLASLVLRRIKSEELAAHQRAILASGAFLQLAERLRQWRSGTTPPPAGPAFVSANDSASLVDVLADLERFETEGAVVAERRLARLAQNGQHSRHPDVQRIGSEIQKHYRNANFRIAVSKNFMDRLIPESPLVKQPVNDTILGSRVFGQSVTSADLRVVLVPDNQRWRIGLFAEGEVASSTSAYNGPARFGQIGSAQYQATKEIILDRTGMQVQQARVLANGRTSMTSLETEYDGIPLLGDIARSVARKKYEERTPVARRIVSNRIASQVGSQMDREVAQRASQLDETIRTKAIQPLVDLHLKPVPLQMATTEERLIGRFRLASDEQLGAYSPRPQAPADSWLSMQVHQSIINNTFRQLGFDGKSGSVREVVQSVADAFSPENKPVRADIPDDVFVRFADEDALRVQFDDGGVHIKLNIAELRLPSGKVLRNFNAQTRYVPQVQGVTVELIRDDIVSVGGPRIGFRDRLPIRAVFSKVFAKKRPFELITTEIIAKSKLDGTLIGQFLVRDGWVGVAFRPTRQLAQSVKVKDSTGQAVRR